MGNGRVPRPALAELGLNTGKKARLHRILYQHGLRNGTAMFLPYDQGLEHGPRDFFDNPAAGDPAYIVKLAVEGGFNGVAVQVGSAEKFFWDYAGEVPLILKLNGRTEIPSAAAPRSPLNASVEDAVRLGADAVGYTLYVGSPRQDEDFARPSGCTGWLVRDLVCHLIIDAQDVLITLVTPAEGPQNAAERPDPGPGPPKTRQTGPPAQQPRPVATRTTRPYGPRFAPAAEPHTGGQLSTGATGSILNRP